MTSLIIASIKGYQQVAGFITQPSQTVSIIAVVIIWLFFAFMLLLSLGKLELVAKPSYLALGALTYPLYLIHNVAGKALIDHYKATLGEGPMIVLTIGLMLLLAYIVTRWIEKPIATPLKHKLLQLIR